MSPILIEFYFLIFTVISIVHSFDDIFELHSSKHFFCAERDRSEYALTSRNFDWFQDLIQEIVTVRKWIQWKNTYLESFKAFSMDFIQFFVSGQHSGVFVIFLLHFEMMLFLSKWNSNHFTVRFSLNFHNQSLTYFYDRLTHIFFLPVEW